jgi:hypothetical protein
VADRELRESAIGRNVAKPRIPKFASGNFSINPDLRARKRIAQALFAALSLNIGVREELGTTHLNAYSCWMKKH